MVIFLFLPPKIKRYSLSKIEIPVKSFQLYSSTLLYRYSTIISHKDYSYFNKTVWNERPDPFNPNSGWNSRTSTLLFPLTGENVGIVPANSIGYKMDNTCNASAWDNNSYSYSDISMFFSADTIDPSTELLSASVYCYVSDDFNGTWANISAEGNVSGIVSQDYDLTRKGVWQKLNICFKITGKSHSVYLYWALYNSSNFSNLRGFIVFACPEFRKIMPDPKNPTSGWASRRCILEFPLGGENVEVVPQNSIGYKMDSTSNASSWNNNAYSYTDISNLFIGDNISSLNDSLMASVYCYISKDFNGSWANISAEGDVSGKTVDAYDLSRKGVWQKLSIRFVNKGIRSPVYLYWAKNNSVDFRDLKGYIIFAHPEYSVVPPGRDKKNISASVNTKSITALRSSMASAFSVSSMISGFNSIFNTDSVRKKEDVNFLEEQKMDYFAGTRMSRWYYSWIIFKEYPLHKKLFGGGFDYLEMIGTEFGEVRYDYPHNPFISAFLYSGIIGGLAYIWFMFLSFLLLYKILSSSYLLFYLFSRCFLFQLF